MQFRHTVLGDAECHLPFAVAMTGQVDAHRLDALLFCSLCQQADGFIGLVGHHAMHCQNAPVGILSPGQCRHAAEGDRFHLHGFSFSGNSGQMKKQADFSTRFNTVLSSNAYLNLRLRAASDFFLRFTEGFS